MKHIKTRSQFLFESENNNQKDLDEHMREFLSGLGYEYEEIQSDTVNRYSIDKKDHYVINTFVGKIKFEGDAVYFYIRSGKFKYDRGYRVMCEMFNDFCDLFSKFHYMSTIFDVIIQYSKVLGRTLNPDFIINTYCTNSIEITLNDPLLSYQIECDGKYKTTFINDAPTLLNNLFIEIALNYDMLDPILNYLKENAIVKGITIKECAIDIKSKWEDISKDLQSLLVKYRGATKMKKFGF